MDNTNNLNLPKPTTTLQLQAEVQNELTKLNAARLGVVDVFHAEAMVTSSTTTLSELTFQASNVLQTIERLKHCPDVRVYIDVPIHDANGNPLTTKQRIELRRNALSSDSCNFNISVYQDNFGFVIKPNLGHPYHIGRPMRPFIRMPSRFMSAIDQTVSRSNTS